MIFRIPLSRRSRYVKNYLVLLSTVGLRSFVLDIRVLDGQAPDIKIIADGDNDINNEAAIHTSSRSEHHEHEGNLVNTVTKSTRPADPKMLLEDGPQRVDDTESEG